MRFLVLFVCLIYIFGVAIIGIAATVVVVPSVWLEGLYRLQTGEELSGVVPSIARVLQALIFIPTIFLSVAFVAWCLVGRLAGAVPVEDKTILKIREAFFAEARTPL